MCVFACVYVLCVSVHIGVCMFRACKRGEREEIKKQKRVEAWKQKFDNTSTSLVSHRDKAIFRMCVQVHKSER